MSRRSSSGGRGHRSLADDFPLEEARDRRPRPPPLPFPPNAPRNRGHLQQLLQATGTVPYETRIVTPTSNPYQRRPESSPLSRSHGTRIVEPDDMTMANVDTDDDFDRFIDDLEEADLPGFPSSFNARTSPSTGLRGPPPSPTFSDDAMDSIQFPPTMPRNRGVDDIPFFRDDRAPGLELEREMEAALPGPRFRFNPAEMETDEEDDFDRRFGQPAGNEPLRLADDLLQQATTLEARIRQGARLDRFGRQNLRIAQDSVRDAIQALADPAQQAPGPIISIDALSRREITIADQGEDGHATCSICQEHIDVGTTVTQLSCRHWFCTECLEPWLHRRTCPSCPFSSDDFETALASNLRRSVMGHDCFGFKLEAFAPRMIYNRHGMFSAGSAFQTQLGPLGKYCNSHKRYQKWKAMTFLRFHQKPSILSSLF
ncbi:uncharacterized protein MYCFIDRAFT_171832 [Pseudocercospora fijiensis CIRAD86]|uniref:RING-type E3 ubiquitin transferase n=1 Tax=Pseudocercospora fijiensis (strain CIRAD86) TaxID=383855 RepID=M3B9S3_PSEFD|nr:uncharacterized protein MYCFIDRAFT_171832 [Pseudocercospora fijiensis CIRAD86]EME86008.1 hypothetical protein MYCFIDRAFT_171832 [Pseudocercospora fijiensis CIRAD86]